LSVDVIAKIFIFSNSTIYEWRNNHVISYDIIRIFNKKSSIFEYDKLIVDHVIKNKLVNHIKIYNIVKSKFNKNISRRTIYKILK
jgi:hypothetical protein